MQEASLSDLLFGIEDLIAYISSIMPLDPGDLIVTGTPGGVGLSRSPHIWMKPGDRIEVEVSGVGTLRNDIVDDL
jgi:2-keto-4-pentenoate hydratase/2-oxohepta-3-ene-1,7-dioic acid hydratase in catechol pathway